MTHLFILLEVSFDEQMLLSLVYLLVFYNLSFLFPVAVPKIIKVFSYHFPEAFSYCTVYLELVFLYGVRWGQILFFLSIDEYHVPFRRLSFSRCYALPALP